MINTFNNLKRQYPYIAKTFERGKFFNEEHLTFTGDGFCFSTKNYKYEISCQPKYLGCIAGTKTKPWRGNDLSDGKNNERTWRDIVSDVLSYELE